VLGQAERAAIASALADVPATSARAARLLASIAACGSAHLAVLARLPATSPAKKTAKKPPKKKAGA
jgi:hypothetical protein